MPMRDLSDGTSAGVIVGTMTSSLPDYLVALTLRLCFSYHFDRSIMHFYTRNVDYNAIAAVTKKIKKHFPLQLHCYVITPGIEVAYFRGIE